MLTATTSTRPDRSILGFSAMSLKFGLALVCLGSLVGCRAERSSKEPERVAEVQKAQSPEPKPESEAMGEAEPAPTTVAEAQVEPVLLQDPVDGVRVRVKRITDGDTFVAMSPKSEKWKIRLLGFDCPEVRVNPKCKKDGQQGRKSCEEQIPLGRAATKRARQLLEGQEVTLEGPSKTKPLKKDRYGRILAYVRLADGRDFGAVMVGETECEDFGWKFPHPRSETYKSLKTATKP